MRAVPLLPCPFCGGEMQFRGALWPSEGDTEGIMHKDSTDCGMADFNIGATDESTIAAWNHRAAAPDAPPADEPVAWRLIETAPKTGPCKDVILYVPSMLGTGGSCIAHWAFGGGEDQPAFGPAWFFWTGYQFAELRDKPTHWQPLPEPPSRGVK